jgi:hypothetical protein
MESAVLSIATDLQTVLGEAMATTTAIFPQKPVAPIRGTLFQHL